VDPLTVYLELFPDRDSQETTLASESGVAEAESLARLREDVKWWLALRGMSESCSWFAEEGDSKGKKWSGFETYLEITYSLSQGSQLIEVRLVFKRA
jgi:hypothetical protein